MKIESAAYDQPATITITGLVSFNRAQRAYRHWLPLLALVLVTIPMPVLGAEDLPAYVNTTALNLRAEPGSRSAILGILLKYDAISVVGERLVGATKWYSVDAAGGYTNGWVAARYVEFGESPAIESKAVDYGVAETPTLVKGPIRYVGVAACRECHSDPTGTQTQGASLVWEHHVHASAFATLKRGYSRQIAKRARGVENPESDWRCVKCHTTAYGADPSQLAASYRVEDGVGCEACHGPGGEYAEADHGPDAAGRAAMGFVILDELYAREKLCTRCHQPASPTYKTFNLREYSREIAHWAERRDDAYYAFSKRVVEERELAIQRMREVEEKSQRADALALDEAEVRAAEERAKKEAELARQNRRREAEAVLARNREAKRQEAAAREEAARRAKQAAKQSAGVERHLEELDDVMILNTEGVKYRLVEFSHAAHASGRYLPDGDCVTCHHEHEGDDAPEGCRECHAIGGDADEKKLKSRASHSKHFPFPKEPDQDQVSCVGCHKSQNELRKLGQRKGEVAPFKCTACHKRK